MRGGQGGARMLPLCMSQAAADALVVEADALLDADRPSDAAACYEKAANLCPPHGRAWRGLGHSLLALGRPREAARAFDHAIGLLPHSATTLWGGAVAHAEIGNDAVAERYLRRTLGLQPTWIDMARGVPELAVFLRPAVRAAAVLRERLGAIETRTYRHAEDRARRIEVGRIADAPEVGKTTFVTIGLADHEWPDPRRPRIELALASSLDSEICGAILSNLALHLADTGTFPEPGLLVRDVVGALDVLDLSLRLPHVVIAVPRAWILPLPLDDGPPPVTLAQVICVSEAEYARWREDTSDFDLVLAARGVDVADLSRAGT